MSAVPQELLGLRVAVLRSPRRTAALHIVGSELQVRVPAHLADDRVAAILQRKRPWIRSKVAQLQQLPPPRQRELVSGESFPYLGRHYRLQLRPGPHAGVALRGGVLLATLPDADLNDTPRRQVQLRGVLEDWYRARALERLHDKTKRLARRIGVAPTGVSVRRFKARWGSCHRNGQLVFHWPLIQAPHPIIDAVVIHELCHLLHPNHSNAFWQLVHHHDPAHSEHRQWLRRRAQEFL